MPTIELTLDDLIARSGELKRELLDYAWNSRCSRELGDAIVEHFGNPVVADEHELVRFYDRFVLEHRFSDGRTVVERFIRARGDLPRTEREMLRGWHDVVESAFEVDDLDGETLLVTNLVDEMTYRVNANVDGLAEMLPPGSLFLARVVPVLDEWLISGVLANIPPEMHDVVLSTVAEMAVAHSEATCRNPRHRERAQQMQRDDRERFLAHHGRDLVVVRGRELPARAREHAAATERATPDPSIPFPDVMLEAETVGMIYDEAEGLGYFKDFGRLQEAFARPELIGQAPGYADVVLAYLMDESVSPVPLHRCVQEWPDHADEVFARVLRRRKFSWERDGDALLRRYKSSFLDRTPAPNFTIVSDRLARYVRSPERVRTGVGAGPRSREPS